QQPANCRQPPSRCEQHTHLLRPTIEAQTKEQTNEQQRRQNEEKTEVQKQLDEIRATARRLQSVLLDSAEHEPTLFRIELLQQSLFHLRFVSDRQAEGGDIAEPAAPHLPTTLLRDTDTRRPAMD